MYLGFFYDKWLYVWQKALFLGDKINSDENREKEEGRDNWSRSCRSYGCIRAC